LNPVSSPIHIILNTLAGTNGSTETIRQRLGDLFTRQGITPHIVVAHRGRDILDLTRGAVRKHSRMMVAVGGDGTLNAVAAALVDTDVALGIVPLGTLNHFAKDVGIPLDLASAVRTILDGRVVRVDVGDVNGRVFLNNSGLGLYPLIVRDRQKQQKRYGRGKWLAFVWATFRVLRRYPFLRLDLCLNGTDIIRRRTPFVFVGNNVYQMDALHIGSRLRLDAGTLSLYTTHPVGRLGLLKLGIHLLAGQLHGQDDFSAFMAQDVMIKACQRRLRVATDGEVTVLKTPLHYRIRQGALQVIVPAATQVP
jgi:diacylglycerol kinase family enzyme